MHQRAVLAGGCFWGMQDLIRKLPGVVSTRVGYTGGDTSNATYRNHGTHAEGIEIVFDTAETSYRRILEYFFQIHDPTTRNRQGNDIYTREDQLILTRAQALPAERIMGVETGGCPHTAIREDASMNLAAIEDMNRKFPRAELSFIESGGDNLAATFSPELADLTIYLIDVAAGEKIPRKGGPGITRSDLLVINKIDLASLVGANLDVMRADALKMRVRRPFIFTNLKSGDGVDQVASFVIDTGGLRRPAA